MFEYGIAYYHIGEDVTVLDYVYLVQGKMVVNDDYFVINSLLAVSGVHENFVTTFNF